MDYSLTIGAAQLSLNPSAIEDLGLVSAEAASVDDWGPITAAADSSDLGQISAPVDAGGVVNWILGRGYAMAAMGGSLQSQPQSAQSAYRRVLIAQGSPITLGRPGTPLQAQRRMAGAGRDISLIWQQIDTPSQYKVPGEPLSYAVTGQEAGFRRTLRLAMGTLALSVTVPNLPPGGRGRTMVPAKGEFGAEWGGAGLLRGLCLKPDAGHLGLAAGDSQPQFPHRVLGCSPGTADLSPGSASLLRGFLVSADGSLAGVGLPASDLLCRRQLAPVHCELTLAEASAQLKRSLRVTAGAASLALAGDGAGLLRTYVAAGTGRVIALAGQSASLLDNRRIAVGPMLAQLRSATPALVRRAVIAPDQGALVVAAEPAVLTRRFRAFADLGIFVGESHASQLVTARRLRPGLGQIGLAQSTLALCQHHRLPNSSGSFAISSSAATPNRIRPRRLIQVN